MTRFAADRKARADQELARLTAELRHAYLSADPAATEEGFRRALPALLEERRKRAALAGANEALASFRRQYRG